LAACDVNFPDGTLRRSSSKKFSKNTMWFWASCAHPHIVAVYDAGEWDCRQYLVTAALC
jgi:hypothetical protein